MTDYGVTPTGFVRKPLPTLLAEIEALAATQFGPDVIQTSQSPLGQLNGMMADAIAQLWEFGEDVYQSYDPDQAEGARLEILGRLRLLDRAFGETDAAYRNAITNAGRARVDLQDLLRAVRAIDGVTYAQVFINESNDTDDFTVPPGNVVVAVIGGDDDEIGQAIRQYIVPGISTYGNTPVNTVIDGLCRTFNLLRPAEIPVSLVISVNRNHDRLGCPAPDATAIKTALVQNINLINGDDITYYRIRQVIESAFPQTVEVVSVNGTRDNITFGPNVPVTYGFFELATIAVENITITVLDDG